MTRQVIEIPLELLDPGTNVRGAPTRDRTGRRRHAAPNADAGLRDSIRALGVLQPITVVRRGKRFEVLYGHRRTAAARAAGLATIPAIVETEPAAKPIRQLVENQHRLPVNPIDIARTLRAYLDEHPGVSQADIARMVGRSQWWVSTKLALLDLTPAAMEAVARGEVAADQAHAAHKAATPQGQGRPKVFRLDPDHLEGDGTRSASVVIDLPTGSGRGSGKATISVERGETPSIDLLLEDGTGHGVMLTISRDAAKMLGHRLMQAFQATAPVAAT